MAGLALRETFMRSTKLARCSFFAGSSHGRCMTSVASPETASRFKNRKSNKKADSNHRDHGYFHDNNNRRGPSFNSDDPNLHRMFFMSPDKIHSLEQAQVFISYIKSNYGPLTQYQFSRVTPKLPSRAFTTFQRLERVLRKPFLLHC